MTRHRKNRKTSTGTLTTVALGSSLLLTAALTGCGPFSPFDDEGSRSESPAPPNREQFIRARIAQRQVPDVAARLWGGHGYGRRAPAPAPAHAPALRRGLGRRGTLAPESGVVVLAGDRRAVLDARIGSSDRRRAR